MFNKYWRDSPWFMQLIQFVLLFFICAGFFVSIALFVIPALTGVESEAIQNMTLESTPKTRIAFFIIQGVTHFGMFTVSAALFVYATHPRPLEYLNIKMPQNSTQWLWGTLLAFGSIPLLSGVASLFDMIPLGSGLEEMKATFEAQQKAYLNMTTSGEFIAAFIVMTFVPAIGEELLFRGVMMRFAAKKMVGTIFWPIIFTAVFFAMMHGNVVGFISLMIAGIIMGYVYYLSGSLILSMFVHFIVNGTQIAMTYYGRDNETIKAFMDTNETPWSLFAVGVVLFAVSFYMLWKNRTPLAANWTEDFNEEEKAQLEQN